MKRFLPLLLVLAVAGCQKEASFQDKSPSPSIFGTWKFDSFKDAANHQTAANNPCLADNTLSFNEDFTASLSHGPCRDEEFPLASNLGKWSISKDQILSLDGRQRKIRQLTDSTLWFGEDTGDKIYEFRWKR